MRVIDAHAHLDDPRFAGDADGAVTRAAAAGVERIVSCGGDIASSELNLALAHRHPGVLAAVGVHPHSAARWSDEDALVLELLARDERVVAIGEIGMDFSGRSAPREAQERAFLEQLRLAVRLGLPAVVHVREAGNATRALIDRVPGARGMIHCYSESAAEIEGWVARGFFISFAGNATYPANARLREAAVAVPADRILLETDAPYLQPQTRRREHRNEPAFVLDTLAAIAAARGEAPDLLAAQVVRNAATLFGGRWP